MTACEKCQRYTILKFCPWCEPIVPAYKRLREAKPPKKKSRRRKGQAPKPAKSRRKLIAKPVCEIEKPAVEVASAADNADRGTVLAQQTIMQNVIELLELLPITVHYRRYKKKFLDAFAKADDEKQRNLWIKWQRHRTACNRLNVPEDPGYFFMLCVEMGVTKGQSYHFEIEMTDAFMEQLEQRNA